jgi:hypothetical protein
MGAAGVGPLLAKQQFENVGGRSRTPNINMQISSGISFLKKEQK